MIQILKALVDLVEQYIPLLGSLFVIVSLALLLSRSIKKHAKVYYWVFGVIAFLLLTLIFLPLFGVQGGPGRSMGSTPFIGLIFKLFFSIYGFSFPTLLLIMYMGALSPKYKPVARLMSIRKELSIIVGFPVIVHATSKIMHITPYNLRYIFGGVAMGSVHGSPVDPTAELLMHIAFFIGLFLAALFLLLWITSFTAVHRALGGRRWKAIQRWSYLFYGLLCAHSVLLRTSWIINTISNEADALPHLIGLITTLLIFASYLILRVRKAVLDKRKRALRSTAVA